MTDIVFDPEKQYLHSKVYEKSNGETTTIWYLVPRTATSHQRGRPTDIPTVDTKKLKELRDIGLSWNKIAKNLGISAYHARKIYESI